MSLNTEVFLCPASFFPSDSTIYFTAAGPPGMQRTSTENTSRNESAVEEFTGK